MSTGREPENLVRALAEERVPPEAPEILAARRERLVPLVALKIREASVERERRERFRRALKIAAVAASVVFAAGAGHRLHHAGHVEVATRATNVSLATVRDVEGTLIVTHGGRAQVVSGAEVGLSGGDELRTTGDGRALLRTERSVIRVAPATQLKLLSRGPDEERIRLSLGRVELKVQKVPQSNRSVVVETPNTEVVVHGTMFSVSVGEEQDSPVTRVRVTEGSVWVLHEGKRELLAVGSEWTSAVGGRRFEPAPVAAPIEAPSSAPRGAGAHRPLPASPSRPAPSGSLGEENRMFQAAVDARNQGDDARALELFGALLAKYPKGRLAEEGRVERIRALRRLGNSTGAAAEARRYLAEHPLGFAQEEARGDALGK